MKRTGHSGNSDRSLSRREWMRLSSAGAVGLSMSGWLGRLAEGAATDPARKRSCILLWMPGGPSQTDTFDLKPGHANGGPFKEIQTSVPGIRISEHLPKLARWADDMAIVRSMSTKEGDHSRATYFLRTGYLPSGPVQYPTLGSVLGKELGNPDAELPSFVSIASSTFFSPGAYSPGFLGSRHAPLMVGANAGGGVDYARSLAVENLASPSGVTAVQEDARMALLTNLEDRFRSGHPGEVVQSHNSAYRQAVKMMRSKASEAFNLEGEPAALRDAYGRNTFGQGCLLARRLVERGVPFVEVSLSGGGVAWDTHQQNFTAVKTLSQQLDPGWGTLMEDLKTRGLLESTLIVWMGEFGRTPTINPQQGRDHFPNAWTTVLAGGGIRGGQAIGRTSSDGMTVEDRPVTVPEFLSTVCSALGVDPLNQNMSNVGRPIRLVDPVGSPIKEALA